MLLPLAAGAPAAFTSASGNSMVVYRTASGDIIALTPNDDLSQSWTATNLSLVSGAPPAAGDPMMYMRSDGYTSIVYRGAGDGHVREIYSWDLKSFFNGDISGQPDVGAPAALGNPYGYTRHDGTNAVVFRGTDNNIWELFLDAQGWHSGNLQQQTSLTSPCPTAAGDPAAYVRSDGASAVVFRSSQNNLIELSVRSGTGWLPWADLTFQGGGATWQGSVAGDPMPYVRADGVSSIVYHDWNDRIGEISMTGPQAWDLTQASGEGQ
jgi:hypothetical protein